MAQARSPFRWFTEGGWYFAIVVLSLGILSPVPFAHAATRLRTPLSFLWPVLYAAAVVGLMVAPRSEGSNSAIGGLIVGQLVVALCHLVWLRRRVWPQTAPPQAPTPPPTYGSADPAVAAAMAARARREEARRIVAQDPSLARELRIGRPDLNPSYYDGGLVDLGGAPVAVIASVCGIEPEVAQRIVDARTAQPPTGVDDVFAFTDIPYPLWERIRDRAVVVR
jgi:hypothetical protein